MTAASANRSWSCSTTRACCAQVVSASGCSKTERTSVATIACADFGTRVSRLRTKCVRQRCQLAPGNTPAIAFFKPSWASEITSCTPDRPRATSDRKNAVRAVFGREHVHAQHLTVSLDVHARRDDTRDVHDPATFADLLGERVNPHVRVGPGVEGPGPERFHDHIERSGELAHLRLGDPVDAHRLDDI